MIPPKKSNQEAFLMIIFGSMTPEVGSVSSRETGKRVGYLDVVVLGHVASMAYVFGPPPSLKIQRLLPQEALYNNRGL